MERGIANGMNGEVVGKALFFWGTKLITTTSVK
jgi:hypothetical protein